MWLWDYGARTLEAESLSSIGYLERIALQWWPSLTASLCALALYAKCLAPGLTWAHSGADGGDLLAAALTQGVAHPTGYPTYQLLLRLAIAIFPGEPARAGNWLSAICAAAAVALLADLARRMLPVRPWRSIVALVAALVWAVSPTLWSQAVITEVYALNSLLVLVLIWLMWRWREAAVKGSPSWWWLIGAGLAFGLGLGNHLSFALLVPGLAVWLRANRRLLDSAGALRWAAVLAAIVIGLIPYALLPWAAAGDPPVNWGDPQTADGLWWLVSGRAYWGLPFGVPLADLPVRVAVWFADALRQLAGGPWGALTALAGLWWLDRHDHAWWQLTGLVGLTYSVYAISYNTVDSYVYLIPAWIMAALWFAAGLSWGIELVGKMCRFLRPTIVAAVFLSLLLVMLPAASLARYWSQMDLSRDHEARDFIASVLAEAQPGGVILIASDQPTFALWYARYGLRLRPDLTPVNVNLYAYPWYRKTLVSRHPSLARAAGGEELPSLAQFVAAVGHQRPLYRTEPLSLAFEGFAERPVGTLLRMEPRQAE